MKISTKTGDTGTTHIHGGKIKKGSDTIELMGSLDMCMAEMILCASRYPILKNDLEKHVKLLSLFTSIISGYASTDDFKEENQTVLEKEIELMEHSINHFKFIHPFDNEEAAHLNLIRTHIRKCEHQLWKQKNTYSSAMYSYINRLSDWYYLKSIEVISLDQSFLMID